MGTVLAASGGWTVGLVLGIVVVLVAAAIVITIVAATRITTIPSARPIGHPAEAVVPMCTSSST